MNLCGLVENDDANFSECKRMKLGSGVFRNLEGQGYISGVQFQKC